MVDAQKQRDLSGINRLCHQYQIGGLGRSLHGINTGENGVGGKMAFEDIPLRIHPKGGGDPLTGDQLADLVDQ